MRTLITGATGFIGTQIANALDDIVVLSRTPQRARETLGGTPAFEWNPLREKPPAEAFEGVRAVVHLAGEPAADGRWTAARKRRIRDSRELGTRHLVEAIRNLEHKPEVVVSASAVGFYGDRGDEWLDESSAPADGYLAEVCKAWEAETQPLREMGIRVVNARIGIVLSADGGALAKMLTPFKLGVGGRLADGQHYMPWIHIDDVVGLMLHAIRTPDVDGPMNTVGPKPVTNAKFTQTLARLLRRPAVFPVPKMGLRIAFGEMMEILIASQRVLPKVAQASGYIFGYGTLESALAACLDVERAAPAAA